MIKSRRSRTFFLALWSLIIVILFFAYQNHHQGKAAKAFLDNVEEKTRLESPNLPPKVDKNQDLTTEKGAVFSPEKEYKAILSEAPIVVFSKTYCPFSKKAKEVLAKYQITPDPLYVEIDQHPHGAELQAYIGQVTGRKTVPNVHVKGVSRGGGDDFAEFHESGVLIEKIQLWAENTVRIKKLPVPAGQAGGVVGEGVGIGKTDHNMAIKAVNGVGGTGEKLQKVEKITETTSGEATKTSGSILSKSTVPASVSKILKPSGSGSASVSKTLIYSK